MFSCDMQSNQSDLDYEILGAVNDMDALREDCASLLSKLSAAIEALVTLSLTHDAAACQALARYCVCVCVCVCLSVQVQYMCVDAEAVVDS
jgi:hypothetical protein